MLLHDDGGRTLAAELATQLRPWEDGIWIDDGRPDLQGRAGSEVSRWRCPLTYVKQVLIFEIDQSPWPIWSSSSSSEDALCRCPIMSTAFPGHNTSPTTSNSVRIRVVAVPPHQTRRWLGAYQPADAPGQPRGHRTTVPRGCGKQKSPWRRIASPRRAISADAPIRSPGRTSPLACYGLNTNVGAADVATIALRRGALRSGSTDLGHTSRRTPDSID